MNREWMLKLADLLKYTAFLKYKFLGICPYGEDYLKRLLLKTVGLTGILFVVSTVVLVCWNALFQERTLVYMFGSVLLLWYVVAMEVPNYVVQKKETMLYQ